MVKITKDLADSLITMHKLEGITTEEIENMPLYNKMLDFLNFIEGDDEED